MDTADASDPARSAYLSQLAELIEADPSLLSPESRQRVMAVIADLSLISRSAEERISQQAEDDAELAELWHQVQQEPADVKRGGDLIKPGRRSRGATHLWVCPVANCERAEKGLGWVTVSGKIHCDDHGAKLEPVRIASA
jgi:hypothetical protein